MTDYVSKLNQMKSLINRKDLTKIRSLLDTPVWEYEFYGVQIAKDEAWFDILQNAGIFNFNDFRDEIEEDGQIKNVMWCPFYYLISVFEKIPNKVIPIFAGIMQKVIVDNKDYNSWYLNQIVFLISKYKEKLDNNTIKQVIEPFISIKSPKGSFFIPSELIDILEYLIRNGQEQFVGDVLVSILGLREDIQEMGKIEFQSWNDYYYLLQRIDDSGFFKKYPTMMLKIFISIFAKTLDDNSEIGINKEKYRAADMYGMDYIKAQDKSYFDADIVVIRQILSLGEKVTNKDLKEILYKNMLPFGNRIIVQNLLCYFANMHPDDLDTAYDFLYQFADTYNYPYFGTSDYAKLAFNVFSKLSDKQQREILEKREQAYSKDLEQYGKDMKEQDKIYEIRRFFMPFYNNLPKEFQDKYEYALKDTDPEEYVQHSNFNANPVIFSDTSKLSPNDLQGKSLQDLIDIIKELEKDEGDSFRGSAIVRGTTKVIAQYINSNKALFKDAYVLEDSELIKFNIELLWNLSFDEPTELNAESINGLLNYLSWIVKLPNVSDNVGYQEVIVADMYSAYIAVNNIVSAMLQNISNLQDNNYQEILTILQQNLSSYDRQMTKVLEDGHYYDIALNSIHGTALTTLIRYALKMTDLKREQDIISVSNKIFELASTQNKVYFAVLGRYYPWMQYIVKDKLPQLRNIIFNKEDKEAFEVSFGSYLYNRLYFNLFPELKEYYLYATQSDIFEKDGHLSYIGDALGDHLGILYYKQMITNDDDLGDALLSHPILLRRALWWIISSLVHEKNNDMVFEHVKECINLILTCSQLGYDGYKEVFNPFSMLLESEYFKDNEEWMLEKAVKLLESNLMDCMIYGKELYESLRQAAQKKGLFSLVVNFLKTFLIRPKYEDRYAPVYSGCPYEYSSAEINKIFETLTERDLSKEEKDKLYDLFNALSNYGFYHRIEEYVNKVKPA